MLWLELETEGSVPVYGLGQVTCPSLSLQNGRTPPVLWASLGCKDPRAYHIVEGKAPPDGKAQWGGRLLSVWDLYVFIINISPCIKYQSSRKIHKIKSKETPPPKIGNYLTVLTTVNHLSCTLLIVLCPSRVDIANNVLLIKLNSNTGLQFALFTLQATHGWVSPLEPGCASSPAWGPPGLLLGRWTGFPIGSGRCGPVVLSEGLFLFWAEIVRQECPWVGIKMDISMMWASILHLTCFSPSVLCHLWLGRE